MLIVPGSNLRPSRLATSEKISCIDWQNVSEEMNEKGYALVLQFLPILHCEELSATITAHLCRMEGHSFGLGENKYFKYPLPDLIQTVRRATYPILAPLENTWMKVLNVERQFPSQFDEFQRLCHNSNQTKPTALILKHGNGGHNALHQDLYRDIFSYSIGLILE